MPPPAPSSLTSFTSSSSPSRSPSFYTPSLPPTPLTIRTRLRIPNPLNNFSIRFTMSGGEQYNIDDMPMEVMCDDLFDQIDDLLDFPNYYYEDNHFETVTAAAPPIPPPCKDEESVGAEKPDTVLPFQDETDIAADLEWVSNFMVDTNETFSLKIPSYDGAIAVKKEPMVRTASPNSVLNGSGSAISSSSSSSSSYSSSGCGISKFNYVSCQTNPIISAVPARARSKRPRPSSATFRSEEEIIPKKITIKIKNPNTQYTAISNYADEISCMRKCLHCDVTKTPQWRAGPMGPKTLCNACGVRYKSGRLFPEYRPAASPTFVPAVHSNSHKKVVEMRIHKPAAGMSSRGECDLLNYIRRRD